MYGETLTMMVRKHEKRGEREGGKAGKVTVPVAAQSDLFGRA